MTLNHVIVFVSDMARSVEFYRDVMGLPLRWESPRWTEFDTGAVTLALHAGGLERTGGTRHEQGVVAAFEVTDLDATHRRLRERGARFPQPPAMQEFGARVAHLVDPDGHWIALAERHPH